MRQNGLFTLNMHPTKANLEVGIRASIRNLACTLSIQDSVRNTVESFSRRNSETLLPRRTVDAVLTKGMISTANFGKTPCHKGYLNKVVERSSRCRSAQRC